MDPAYKELIISIDEMPLSIRHNYLDKWEKTRFQLE